MKNSEKVQKAVGYIDSLTSAYVLGTECDGATYHSSKSARERDIHRRDI